MTDTAKRKRGRPKGYKAENPHSERLAVNVTSNQMDSYKAASEREGKTFSAWVREWLDKASKSN